MDDNGSKIVRFLRSHSRFSKYIFFVCFVGQGFLPSGRNFQLAQVQLLGDVLLVVVVITLNRMVKSAVTGQASVTSGVEE